LTRPASGDRVTNVKRRSWIIIGLLLANQTMASLPDSPKNGVLRAGIALGRILNETSPESPVSRCIREGEGVNPFSDSCKSFMDQLQKKLALMTLESDIQMQSEKLSRNPNRRTRRSRMESLSKLYLVSTQAEDTLKILKANRAEEPLHSHIREIMPDLKKVQEAYQAYLDLLAHGKKI